MDAASSLGIFRLPDGKRRRRSVGEGTCWKLESGTLAGNDSVAESILRDGEDRGCDCGWASSACGAAGPAMTIPTRRECGQGVEEALNGEWKASWTD